MSRPRARRDPSFKLKRVSRRIEECLKVLHFLRMGTIVQIHDFCGWEDSIKTTTMELADSYHGGLTDRFKDRHGRWVYYLTAKGVRHLRKAGLVPPDETYSVRRRKPGTLDHSLVSRDCLLLWLMLGRKHEEFAVLDMKVEEDLRGPEYAVTADGYIKLARKRFLIEADLCNHGETRIKDKVARLVEWIEDEAVIFLTVTASRQARLLTWIESALTELSSQDKNDAFRVGWVPDFRNPDYLLLPYFMAPYSRTRIPLLERRYE